MTVANLQNCRTLYELKPEWDDTYLRHRVGVESGPKIDSSAAILGFGKRDESKIEAYPAYDAGYLLRKLPRYRHKLINLYRIADDEWQAGYSTQRLYRTADTAEDALCLLAIELIRQGVL